MQKNKLGIHSYEQLNYVEEKIIRNKIKLLDSSFTFNCEIMDINYLQKLHSFLFEDLYYEGYLKIRDVHDEKSIKIVNGLLQQLVLLGQSKYINKENILQILEKIWNLQLFNDGNTRTLIAYLKIYVDAFNLPIDYDFDSNINSGSKIFKLNNSQQKKVDNI